MRRVLLAALLILVPGVALAQDDAQTRLLLMQVAALKAQLAALKDGSAASMPQIASTGVRLCIPPTRYLKRGSEGNDVANLQIFLSQESSVYPEGSVTGTYGPATERAVARWQSQYGIVSSGDSVRTGLGSVGPRTLSLLHTLWSCGGDISSGWFSATQKQATTVFSAQASSTYPLDTSLAIDFGDGSSTPVVVSSTVCATTIGPCSSVLMASHTYTPGTYTAKLVRSQATQSCLIASQTCGDGSSVCTNLAPACSQRTSQETLSTTVVHAAAVGVPGLGTGTITPGSIASPSPSQQVVQPQSVPAIRVLTPVSGTRVTVGSSLTIGWASQNAPDGSSVALSLGTSGGRSIGTIVANQRSSGSYWWTLPLASHGSCEGDILVCLAHLASPICSGEVCDVAAGTYSILARLVAPGGTVLASGSSMPFVVAPVVTSTSKSSTPTSTSTAVGDIPLTPTSSVPSYGSVAPQSCLYSGVQYPSGVTLNVGCTDLAGGSCSSYGGLALTCSNGQWLSDSGASPSIQNVTTYTGGTACTTPWGGQRVQSGQQITYEPFFTGGQYTGAQTNLLMQCTSGAWQKCSWDGTNCQAYTVI